MLDKEPGSLIKYYKTGHQEDGYKGYSTNYQDLDIDIYKIELWKLLRDILRLLDCDVQDLEDQIFPTIIGEDGDNCRYNVSNTINNSRASNKYDTNNNDRKAKNIKRNDHWININHYLKMF